MKDTITMGAIAGAIGGAAGIIFSHSLFLLGVTEQSSLHLAAALVVTDMMQLTTGEIIWAVITHHFVAALFGIFMTLVLLYSGKDYWAVKGIVLGIGTCLVLHAYLLPLVRPDLNMRPSAAAFGTMAFTHALIGIVTAFIIVRYYKFPVTNLSGPTK